MSIMENMKIQEPKIKISDIIDGYEEGDDGQVIGLAGMGMLNIRPPYQREYIHDGNINFKIALIQSIYHNRPINLIYFAKAVGGRYNYELLDGQQRIITICKFIVTREFYVIIGDDEHHFWDGLSDKDQKRVLSYKLHVHVCEGDADELMRWFKTINTGAMKLTDQELRNSIYNGPWVTNAKSYFTKKGNQAKICNKYLSGKRERQEHLEKILQWRVGSSHDQYSSKRLNLTTHAWKILNRCQA